MLPFLLIACGSAPQDSKEETDPPDTGIPWVGCVNFDLGSEVGDELAAGSNIFYADNVHDHCEAGGGHDVLFTWTPPSAGTWVVTTEGTEYDTVLVVFEGECPGDGDLVACNDDAPDAGPWSAVEFAAEVGAAYLIVLDAFSDPDRGDWVINIHGG